MRSASPASSLVVTTPSAGPGATRVPQLTDQAQRAPLRLHAERPIAERQCGERAATAQVYIDVVSQSPTLRASISELLADDRTAVQQHTTISSLQGPYHADLIVLDRPILGSLFSDLRRLRRASVTTEIVVLRAHDAVDVIRLLDAGADDATTVGDATYTSRLHAHARRARTRSVGEKTEFADLRFDRETNSVWCGRQVIALTPVEAAVLRCLFAKAPGVVSNRTLAEWVWGLSDTQDRRAVIRVYIGYLRDKLQRSQYTAIRSVHGVGYQLGAR
jgi:two-component system, OmpR family, response regulator MprA